MIGMFRQFARAFTSYRRWHATVLVQKRRSGTRASAAQRGGDAPHLRGIARQSNVIDFPGAQRLRCISEPCVNTRLAIALLRAPRQVPNRTAELGTVR